MGSKRIAGSMGVMALVMIFVTLFAAKGTQAQGQNLLTNPDFEGQYTAYIPNPPIASCPVGPCGTAQMPAGWTPWWVVQKPGDEGWINRMPEWKPATEPFVNRIFSGSRAMQYFTFHSTHTAGSYQTVTVPANANVTFSIMGQAWSSATDESYSDFPTPVNMRIGIDPTGGTNAFSPSIVWSGTANPYDAYVPFTVSTQAQGDKVTVFVYSKPEEARKHNDIYWDAASLTADGGAPAPVAAAPSAGSGSGSAPAVPAQSFSIQPTATPDAEGIIYATVGGGDSLWSIAAKAGITLAEILEFNGLNEANVNFVKAGDRLIVGYGEPGGGEPEAEVADTTDAAAVDALAGGTDGAQPAAQAPTPTPAPVASETGGMICLSAFNDKNRNAYQDAAEALLSNVAFTITSGNAVVSNYISDGVSEPYCIRGLDAGVYQISRSVADDEVLTTDSSWTVALTEDGAVAMSFGSIRGVAQDGTALADASAATGEVDSADASDSAETASDSNNTRNIVLILVIVGILLLIAAIGFVLLGRRGA